MSPFTHYFVRKLLRRYLTQSQSLSPYFSKVADLDQVDMAKVLRGRCRSEQEFKILLYELELLIDTYSRLESNQSRYTPAAVKVELKKIENRIRGLLGLRLGSLLPESMPQMLPELQGKGFKFCLSHQLQSGLYHQETFYGLVKRWPRQANLQAYQLVWTLAQQEVPCIITQSPQNYSVWVNLQSPQAHQLLQHGDTLLQPLLKMSPVIQRRQATQVD